MKIFKTNKKDLQKYVIISTDNNKDYFFYLPILAICWRNMGFSPIFFIVGSEKQWSKNPLRRLIIGQTLSNGGSIYILDTNFIHRDGRFQGYHDSAMAQICRMCPSIASDLDKNSYCLTSDSDMIPLRKSYFDLADSSPIHIFYENAYHYRRFPVCYIGMNINTWDYVLGVGSIGNEYAKLAGILGSGLKKYSPKQQQWNYDQTMITNRIMGTGMYNKAQKIHRNNVPNPNFRPGVSGVPGWVSDIRLDRSYWHTDQESLNKFVEVHCKRSSYLQQNWIQLLSLLKYYFSQEDTSKMDKYRKGFMELSK